MSEVIRKEQVMPLFLEAAPSFRSAWDRYASDTSYDEELLYAHLGEVARFLVDSMKNGETTFFPAVFSIVERLHLDGDDYVSEAATIGLLEGIQNLAGEELAREFEPFLEPESKQWWDKLNRFWDGDPKPLQE